MASPTPPPPTAARPPPAASSLSDFWRDDYAPLRWAGSAVLRCLRDDEEAPDADLYRRIGGGGTGGGGGPPPPPYSPRAPPSSSAAAAAVPTVRHLRSAPLPALLQDGLRSASLSHSSFMGLLPGAGLAWVSADDSLWLWGIDDLSGGPPLCQFRVPSGQPVVAVGLVRPKPGVFVRTVEWCAVVTTPNQVLLCALNRAGGAGGDEDLEEDPGSEDPSPPPKRRSRDYRFVPTLYSVATEHVVLSVAGTNDGRVFLGGDDGSLSELVYQGPCSDGGVDGDDLQAFSLDLCLRDFYDLGRKVPAVLSVDAQRRVTNYARHDGNGCSSGVSGGPTLSAPLRRWGKRTWSALAGGASDNDAPPNGGRRTHKRAKVVDCQPTAASVLSSIVPEGLIRLFTRPGSAGKIVQLRVDEDRQTLYALSSNGTLAAHDLRSTVAGESASHGARCRLELPRVARSYLEAVARGQLYAPPGTSFPGGDSAAQSGVGGMEGARRILKAADFGGSGSTGRSGGTLAATPPDVLKPVAIHVIPPVESQRLTLVAVTAGGLRLYLSSLAPGVLSSGPALAAAASSSRYASSSVTSLSLLAPRALTLCHIRAPPPVPGTAGGGADGEWHLVDASFCRWGTFVGAVDRRAVRGMGTGPSQPATGNVLVATALDAVLRPADPRTPDTGGGGVDRDTGARTPVRASGGMVETVTLPMDATDGILPGGIVWEIADVGTERNPIEQLTLLSQTPTDAELSVGPPPPFVPPSKLRAGSSSTSSKSGPMAPREASGVLSRPASLSSVALTVLGNAMANIFTTRPLRLGLQFLQSSQSQTYLYLSSGDSSNYRISKRSAVDGFSATAAESAPYADRQRTRSLSLRSSSSASATARSARLRTWLLRPPAVSLNQLATLHLAQVKQIVALNAGGVHYFGLGSILSKLADALTAAGENAGTDAGVTLFFQEYGFKEGCAMCLALCIGCGPALENDILRRRAKDAALARAYVPRLTPVADSGDRAGTVVSASQRHDESLVPPGYEFHPSELSRGVLSLFARLVRPVWFKPAVVVTEGRVIKFPWSRGPRYTPAKVELLLGEGALEALLEPLSNLLILMSHMFARAVKSVPGGAPPDANMMEVDDDDGNLITRALEYNAHRRAVSGSSVHYLSPSDADAIARLVEEKNLHCLYRLLSRVVQLLKLLSLLRRAHNMPELNEVEWGLLHGLTVSQLVQTPEGQERLESLLNSLVTSSTADGMTVATPSAQSDQLAMLFSKECYLFFSPGSRSAYLGFRYANEALRCPEGSERRASLLTLAAENLRTAAQHWYSAPLISGRILHTKGNESVDHVALRAMQHGSPLARAVDVLVGLGDVASAVDVCLITASNFKASGLAGRFRIQPVDSPIKTAFPWEYNLYHKRRGTEVSDQTAQGTVPSSPNKLVTYGANVTANDAIHTCYALLFHQLSVLLKSQHPLSNNMVSACAASTDPEFLSSLFLFLLESGRKDTLLRIDSAELEVWLRQRQDPELLWSYYNFQGRFHEAAKVSRDVACDSSAKRPLSERIDWLRRTVADWEAAKESAAPHETFKVSHELGLASDSLRIAQIQSRILEETSVFKKALTAEELETLSYTVIPATELYNDYAARYGLFEPCLMLLHACEFESNGPIESNWKGVLCEEFLPCATRSETAYSFLQHFVSDLNLGDDVRFLGADQSSGSMNLFELGNWAGRVEERVVRLGKELHVGPAAYVFPVPFLLVTLEELAGFAPSIEPNWPLMVLAQAQVPFPVILDVYEAHMYQERRPSESSTATALRRLNRISCVVDLLEYWMRRARGLPIGSSDTSKDDLHRALVSGRLQATLGTLKARLEPSPDSAGLLQRINDIDESLEYFAVRT